LESRTGVVKIFPKRGVSYSRDPYNVWHTRGLIKFGNKTANIKCKKLISLQHRVRAMKSHI